MNMKKALIALISVGFFLGVPTISSAACSPVALGGTGSCSITVSDILFGNGTSAIATSSIFTYTTATSRLSVTNASTTALSATTLCFTGDICRTTWPSSSVSGGTTGMMTSWASPTTLTATSTPTASAFFATSTLASQFPYASSTALTLSGAFCFGGVCATGVTGTGGNVVLSSGGAIFNANAVTLPVHRGGTAVGSTVQIEATTNAVPNSSSAVLFNYGAGAAFESARMSATNGNWGIGSTTPWAQLSASSTSANPAFAVQQNSTGLAGVFNGGGVRIGPSSPSITTENLLSVIGNANDYHGIFVQNLSNGASASTDIVVGNDNTADTNAYADFGANSSGNTNAAFTLFGKNDAYLFSNTGLGNLVIANASTTKNIIFGTGGLLTANERMRITSTGNVGISTTTPFGKLALSLNSTDAAYPGNFAFVIASSTASATTTLFSIGNTGAVTLGGSGTTNGLLFANDNSADIGASAANRPHSLFVGTNITAGATISGTTVIAGSGGVVSGLFQVAGSGTLIRMDQGAGIFFFGNTDGAAPTAQTFHAQSVIAGTSNTAGANWTFQGSKGTGLGAGGSILFQTAPAGTTGTAQNALTTALAITGAGNVGVGTTTPWGRLALTGADTSNTTLNTVFADSNNVPLFSLYNSGKVAIASTTPSDNWGFTVGTTTVHTAQVGVNIASSTTDNAAETVVWNSSNEARFLLNQNTVFTINATSSGPLDGFHYILFICQDPVGSRTVTFATPGQLIWLEGTTTISATANTATRIGFEYDGRVRRYTALASSSIADTRACKP